MIEVIIDKNDSEQRFDRFLRKYLENAPLTLIQKNIRKKNFKINNKRAKSSDIIKEGDKISMYIREDDFNKWKSKNKFFLNPSNLNIIYEDENIIIIDKKPGTLTHAANKKDYGNNIVDLMKSYLYLTGKVSTRDTTFTPAVVNRLDRNTAGLIIGAKNAFSLRTLNQAIKDNIIDKYYLTIVNGKIDDNFTIDTKIEKNKKRNVIKKTSTGSRIITHFKPLESKNNFTVLECKLVTGKTHQIRFSLKENSTPILGDRKYGDEKINNKLKIKNQILLAYKLVFNKIEGLEYLNGKVFISEQINEFNNIKKVIFND